MTYAALLRAINLAGRNMVSMADLRRMLEAQGFGGVRTLLQSGNVIFTGPKRAAGALERALETEAAKRLGVETDFVVRSAADLDAVVSRNPFPREADRDPGHLLVIFLKGAAAPAAVKALQGAIVGREVVRADGAHLYVVYPDGVGRSRLTAATIEKHLSVRGTGRNWNTVLKLRALAAG